MVTNERKEELCKKYKIYLELIYKFGNKVILMKQLWEYAQAMELHQHYRNFWNQIEELVQADILKKEDFIIMDKKTQLQMLTLRKYGIRFIEDKDSSQAVAAVPKSTNNERILLAIFKNCYVLDKVIPFLKRRKLEVTIENIFKILESRGASLQYKKNKGLEYMEEVINNKYLNIFNGIESKIQNKWEEINEYQRTLNILKDNRKKRNANLKIGQQKTEGKGKAKTRTGLIDPLRAVIDKYNNIEPITGVKTLSPKQIKLNEFNFDTMLNSYSYILAMGEKNGIFEITVNIFDIFNKQDIYKITTQVACIYNMFKRYFLDYFKFKLVVGITTFDTVAQKNLEEQSKKIVRHRFTKEILGPHLENVLKEWGIQENEQNNINIKFTNYNITNRYLHGISYLNLLRK